MGGRGTVRYRTAQKTSNPLTAPLVDRPGLPVLRVEHPSRRALMACLVRVILAQPLIPVRPGPTPRVVRTPQRQPEPVESLDRFGPGHSRNTRTPPAKLGKAGKKLSCRHDFLNPHRTGRLDPAQLCHVSPGSARQTSTL